MLTHAVTKLAAARSVNLNFVRHNAKVGRPRVRVSFPEKVAHGMALFIGIMAIPAYIAVNIKHYRGPDDE